jgi:imidazole glycerol phosphate synthase subunit HisF
MTGEHRLERRVRRDFPQPGSANGVLQLLDRLPAEAGYDEETLRSERIRAAIVLLANGDLGKLRDAIELAKTDWRDLLVAAGLAHADWPDRLTAELGS